MRPVWLIAVCFLAGCERALNTRATERALDELPPAEQIDWPFWPASLRVHPLTRLIVDEAGEVEAIEARVEFFDAWGHTTKACGQLRIDLQHASAGLGAEPLALWTVDLRDPKVNTERFDVVTRTYLFRLELGPHASIPGEPELRAYYRTGQGESLAMDAIRLRTN